MSRNDALLEKLDTTSLLSRVEPTLIAAGMQAGLLMALVKPLLPEAMTVATSALRRLLIDCACAAKGQDEVKRPPPRLMLTAAISR